MSKATTNNLDACLNKIDQLIIEQDVTKTNVQMAILGSIKGIALEEAEKNLMLMMTLVSFFERNQQIEEANQRALKSYIEKRIELAVSDLNLLLKKKEEESRLNLDYLILQQKYDHLMRQMMLDALEAARLNEYYLMALKEVYEIQFNQLVNQVRIHTDEILDNYFTEVESLGFSFTQQEKNAIKKEYANEVAKYFERLAIQNPDRPQINRSEIRDLLGPARTFTPGYNRINGSANDKNPNPNELNYLLDNIIKTKVDSKRLESLDLATQERFDKATAKVANQASAKIMSHAKEIQDSANIAAATKQEIQRVGMTFEAKDVEEHQKVTDYNLNLNEKSIIEEVHNTKIEENMAVERNSINVISVEEEKVSNQDEKITLQDEELSDIEDLDDIFSDLDDSFSHDENEPLPPLAYKDNPPDPPPYEDDPPPPYEDDPEPEQQPSSRRKPRR